MRAAVFLDRDGVVIQGHVDADGVPHPPGDVDDVVVTEDARTAMERLRAAGLALVVVTNQPDVARGTTERAVVEVINDRLVDDLALDAVYVCYHDRADDCACRKPRPGMILDAARDHDLDLGASWVIGDRWVDIAAGRAAGVRSLLLEHDYSWQLTSEGAAPSDLEPEARVRSMRECADLILGSVPPSV